MAATGKVEQPLAGAASVASTDVDTKSFISSSDHAMSSHVLLSSNGQQQRGNLAAPSYRPDASTTTLAHSLNPIMLGYDPHNAGMRTLAVDGADDDRSITFSAAGHEKKKVYRLSPPRAPDTTDFPIEVQGLVEDTQLFDEISGQVSVFPLILPRICQSLIVCSSLRHHSPASTSTRSVQIETARISPLSHSLVKSLTSS